MNKYLFDFFVIKDSEGYLIDCDGKSVKELVVNLSKYKIRSKVEIKDFHTLDSWDELKEFYKSNMRIHKMSKNMNKPHFIRKEDR